MNSNLLLPLLADERARELQHDADLIRTARRHRRRLWRRTPDSRR